MGIISLASGSSCWRGLDYYRNKKIIELNKISENEYESVVKGTKNYKVHLDIEHPRKSTCDCPLANGKRIICKHIVATYFTALPREAKEFEEEQEEYEKEQEEYEKEQEEYEKEQEEDEKEQEEDEKEQEEEYNKAIEYLNKMSKQELIN